MPNTTPNRHGELAALLERLNLAGMATVFADLALKAAKEGLTHEAYLYELARHEEELRLQRRTERLLRQSGLPARKPFAPSIWRDCRLHCNSRSNDSRVAAFLEQACNVIAVGQARRWEKSRSRCRWL